MPSLKDKRSLAWAGTDQEKKDLELALMLLRSRSIKPTENEGRRALARALIAIAVKMKFSYDALLLVELARSFDPTVEVDQVHPDLRVRLPESDPARTLKFEMVSKGHPKTSFHISIAREVERLRQAKGKQKAVEAVAENRNMSVRQVQRICRNVAFWQLTW
jgi:hypothetical protein